MTRSGDQEREHGALRERLSRISGAIVRSNESLEFETVSQQLPGSARRRRAPRGMA